MTPRRTEFAAFVLDLLDFVEEKIGEAMENEPSRVAAARPPAPSRWCATASARTTWRIRNAFLHSAT
jgi:hypothetical protein